MEKTIINNEENRKKLALNCVFSLLFSLSFMPVCKAYGLSDAMCVLFTGVLFIIGLILIEVFFKIYEKLSIKVTPPSKQISLKVAFGIYIMFVALWGFIFLAYYPGCASTDSNDIFKVILGLDFTSDWYRYDTLNNHHPVVYIFLNWCIISTALFFGASTAKAVACVAVFHLMFLAWCCVHFCRKIYNLTGNSLLFKVSVVFFLFNPLVILYSFTIWKDVLFSGIVLVLGIELFALSLNANEYLRKPTNVVFLAGLFVACCLIRNNGILVVAITLLAVICFFKKQRKTLIKIAVYTMAAYLIVVGPIFSFAKVAPGHFSEAISIPLQQVGYTISHQGELSESEADFFNKIMPLETFCERYQDGSPNSLKFSKNFNDEFLESHKIEFFINYLGVGFKNPLAYFYAWVEQTKSFWCIGASTWYTIGAGYDIEKPISNNIIASFVDYQSLNSILNASIQNTNPVFNIGILVWFMLFAFFYNLRSKRGRYCLCLVPILIVWASLLIAAPATDFRYVFSLHLSLPLMLAAVLFCQVKREEKV